MKLDVISELFSFGRDDPPAFVCWALSDFIVILLYFRFSPNVICMCVNVPERSEVNAKRNESFLSRNGDPLSILYDFEGFKNNVVCSCLTSLCIISAWRYENVVASIQAKGQCVEQHFNRYINAEEPGEPSDQFSVNQMSSKEVKS